MLPIVQRELLVASRKWHTFWTRIAAAAIGFFVVLLTLGADTAVSAGAGAGKSIFSILSWLSFWACFFGGAMLTADSLAVERREGTLGLLFLTDLKGCDVVLGKLAAKSLTGFFCLIAIVPMLAVPLLLGGVTAGEFWRVVAVLLNTLFFSLAVGMIVSVFALELRGVFALAVLAQVLVIFGPLLLAGFFPALRVQHPALLALYPPLGLSAASAQKFAAQPDAFYIALAVTHVGAWSLLLLAGARISRSWQTRPAQGWRLRWQVFRRDLAQGGAVSRAALRRELLDINPVVWLQSRERLMRSALTAFTFVLCGTAFWLNFNSAFHWRELGCAVTSFVFAHAILLLLIAFEAGSLLVEARRDNAMELILSTELTDAGILRGCFLTIVRLFRPALWILAVYDALWMLFVTMYGRDSETSFNVMTGLCLLVTCAGAGLAVVWCALYAGMRARRPSNAAARAFGTIVVAPVILLGVVAAGITAGSPMMALGVFSVATLLNAWMWGHSAYERAHEEFRAAMTENAAPKGAFSEDYALVTGRGEK